MKKFFAKLFINPLRRAFIECFEELSEKDQRDVLMTMFYHLIYEKQA